MKNFTKNNKNSCNLRTEDCDKKKNKGNPFLLSRVFSGFAACLLLFLFMSNASLHAQSSAKPGEIGYKFKHDNLYYEVTGYHYLACVPELKTPNANNCYWEEANAPQGEITIPDFIEIEGTAYYVSNIENKTFQACTGITSVNIEGHFNSIGDSAFFSCTNLTTVSIPRGINSIDDKAFSGCTALNCIIFEMEDPTSIQFGEDVFEGVDSQNCALLVPKGKVSTYKGIDKLKIFKKVQEARFKEGNLYYKIRTIAPLTVELSSEVLSGYLTESEKPIGDISIPASVTHGGQTYAVTAIGSGALGHCEKIKSVTLPNSVTKIGEYAFGRCVSITSITIPESVTSIGNRAFEECMNLCKVTLPASITRIDKYAFNACRSLQAIISKIKNPVISMERGVFSGTEFETCSLFVPEGKIYAYSHTDQWKDFSNIKEHSEFVPLTGIRFAEDEKNIGIKEMYGPNIIYEPANASVKGVSLRTSNEAVARVNVYQSKEVEGVAVGGPVTITAVSADGDHTAIMSLSVINIKVGELFKEGNLYYKITAASPPSVEVSCQKDYGGGYIDNSEKPTGAISIPATITHDSKTYKVVGIGSGAFKDCTDLTKVTSIPASVTYILNSAFDNCNKLNEINLPDALTLIGSSAFSKCKNLPQITLPNSLTQISNFAFYNCTLLKKISIPDSVTVLEQSVFEGCLSLEEVKMPALLNQIQANAFKNCSGLKGLTIGKSVTYIDYAGIFYACSSLEQITVDPENKHYVSIDGVLFDKDKAELIQYPAASSRTEYVIPGGVERIGVNAFGNSTNLQTITIPYSVTYINSSAFKDCSGLTRINSYGDGTCGLNYKVFENVPVGTCKLYVPKNKKTVYENANQWKSFSNIIEMTESVQSVTLSEKEKELAKGEEFDLIATVLPPTAPNKDVSWKSSDSEVASVDANGHVKALKGGTAYIFVTTYSDGLKDSCKVTVNVPVTGVSIPKTQQIEVGDFVLLVPEFTPDDATNKEVSWESSNTAIADVVDGKVTGKSVGTADITVTCKDSKEKATCTVTVIEKQTAIESVRESTVKLYPNPGINGFTFESSERGILEIYSLSGKMQYAVQIVQEKQFVDTRKLDTGVYVVKFGRQCFKFIKK